MAARKANRAKEESMPKDAWQLFLSQYPEIAGAVSSSIEKIMSLAALDEKTTQLVYIAAQTASCYPLAVKYHVAKALKAGATADEIVGAMAIAACASGPKGLVLCYSAVASDLAKA